MTPLLRTPDVARLLNVHVNTVLRLIEAGELTAIRVGKRDWRISEDDLESFIERKRRA